MGTEDIYFCPSFGKAMAKVMCYNHMSMVKSSATVAASYNFLS